MQFGGVRLQRNVTCVLRDGVKLYADVYCPNGTDPLPVLLMRQPYGKSLASTVVCAHPVWYANQGYMVVVQDVRGRGESEGEFYPYLHEASDGYDAVEWAAKLPRSNGKVGMYGFSYQGATQWAAASLRPPHLAAIAPAMCASDMYRGAFYPRGSFALGELRTWAFQLARDSARRAGDAEAEAYCTRMMAGAGGASQLPISDADDALARYFPAYYDWVEHPEYDAYWEQFHWLKPGSNATVPALLIGGWYDYILDGTLLSYETLQGLRIEKGEAPCDRLLIGPWDHIPWGRLAGGVDHGPAADGNVHREQLRWFDYWLKGEEGALPANEPRVLYYEPGGGAWRRADALPGTRAEAAGKRTLYLGNDGRPANGALGGGRLNAEKGAPSVDIPDVFVYDARLPMRVDSYLPVDRSRAQERYEILVYTGEPLAEAISLLGAPTVTVRCQALGGPTDLVAVLTAVEPDGRARLLSVGRAEIDSGACPADDGPCEATVPMRMTAARLPAGARLRLELTGSAFPLFARHMNGVRLAEQFGLGPEHLHMATVAVYANGTSSYLELPLAPATHNETQNE
ncbi:CocE/NonD family hydrolase [Paenibacillus antri]|uniref:CocE/NonD family hydrolase n=1 Tax=Paenibacillus antri TaxID=2582848 RepID=A0A5R9GFE2_9BACL|nr:CocE/NonD family hydrolase [Paenibacillus antri]TLS52088.1 CocE/NonD family hydrolase [Paenibacillus antri]